MKTGYLFVVAMTALLIGNNAGHALASMNIENTADANMNIQNLLQEYLEDSGTPF